jgi:hypothetical protein
MGKLKVFRLMRGAFEVTDEALDLPGMRKDRRLKSGKIGRLEGVGFEVSDESLELARDAFDV